jgi:hypothetical protein
MKMVKKSYKKGGKTKAKMGKKTTMKKKKYLKGGQTKLDVAAPFGKLTGADFKKLGKAMFGMATKMGKKKK